MYVPKPFQNTERSLLNDFIRENGFAILVSTLDQKITATHIPLHLSDDGEKLYGHVARANPQWKNFDDLNEVLAIFSGPHAYISSSWYNLEKVPTWNYIAAHVYGKIRIVEGEQLVESLKAIVDKYETKSEHPVSVERMTPEYFNRALKGIVGFEITISHVEAAYKLSQNYDQVNHEAIINQLEKRSEGDDQRVANAMRKNVDTIFKS
jgi:transcriptional regulator